MFTVALAERHERKKKSLWVFFLPSVSYSYHVTSVSFDASTVCLVFIPDMEPWITSITLIPRCFTIAPVKEQSSFRKVPLISLHRLSAHKKTQLQAVACVTWSKREKKMENGEMIGENIFSSLNSFSGVLCCKWTQGGYFGWMGGWNKRRFLLQRLWFRRWCFFFLWSLGGFLYSSANNLKCSC